MNNIDLTKDTDKNILEPYSFEDLLQEIVEGQMEINSQTVREQARASIEARYKESMRILNANVVNVVAYVRENKTQDNG